MPDSIVEFLRAKGNPSSHADVAIVFSYWLHYKENMSSYNISDIDKCYDEARKGKPTNITDVMNRNQAKGLLMVTKEKKDGKKTWVITQTGEDHVRQLK